MPIVASGFRPAWWLPDAHLQTVWPTLMRRRPALRAESDEFDLPDGDFLELAWFSPQTNPEPATPPWVMLVHGLEGGLHSHYAGPLIATLLEQGYRVCFMHLRGCGSRPNRLDRSYHSGETGDLQAAVDHASSRAGNLPLAIIGVSLGGNVLLKWLGERAGQALTTAAIAISVPFDLARAAERLNQGLSRIYQTYLVGHLRQSYRRKFLGRADPLAVDLDRLRTFWEFDNAITAPLNGFAGADDYYRQSSSKQYLRDIQRPTLILQAQDDPFLYPDALPGEAELAPQVTMELSERGGHVGFVAGDSPLTPQYFLDRRIVAALTTWRSDLPGE